MNFKLKTMQEKLKYFKIAKELNANHHDLLVKKKLHFRGNINSFSLISLAEETAEIGFSNLKDKIEAEDLLKNPIHLDKPKRDTPEKVLQAWIINYSMNNNDMLPFGENLTFLTSELVLPSKEEYKLSPAKRDLRNDVLGIDDKNNLCIIELKSARDNEVKKQTLEFEKVVVNEPEFFLELVHLFTGKAWNKKIRKISVWPNHEGKLRTQKHIEVEEINYKESGGEFTFN